MRLRLEIFGLLVLMATLAACVAEDHPATTGAIVAAEAPQPKAASYVCEDGPTLTVENRGTEVVVSDGGEEPPVVLAAAPDGQRSRYGASGTALVLDGADALYMKGNKEPLSCRR